MRTSLWLNPFVPAGSSVDVDLAARGLLLATQDGAPAVTPDVDSRHIVDVTDPEAVAWWGEKVARLLETERPDALKLDFGEEIPLDAVCFDGRRGLDIRNAYARIYHAATAAGIPAARTPVPFFCRSGSAGSQATPCHWVGDTPATWDGMAAALRACLSLSLSGLSLVASDGGGFHTPGSGDLPRAILDGEPGRFAADVDPELYGRWGQWAALSPVTRFHGLGLREPTAYPEPWRSAVVEALRLRQRLRPLLVSAYRETQTTGIPMMRPLALHAPHLRGRGDVWHQYQLGRDLLVAPVLEPGGRTTIGVSDTDWVPLLGAPLLSRAGVHELHLEPRAAAVYARPGAVPSL